MHFSKVDDSTELISELKALIASGGQVGPLDERRVRNVVESIKESYEHLCSIRTNPYGDVKQPYYASPMSYYKAKYLRDKRCLLTYLLWRQQQITNAWWSARDNSLLPCLSPAEVHFLEEYDSVMVDYITSFAVPLDLRAFIWRPPSTQQLEVRGLVNHMFVSPVSGNTISIYTGKQLLLSFEDAEALLQQKAVEIV
ncbi:unnamed protein product [Phytomonas sp. Hart1]|nr:unnamed protein product [Phytomonas sp. Hart1]|eukprot:CCW67824.1 unnamed protein product [Phytomonas sp. isolate Hart1]